MAVIKRKSARGEESLTFPVSRREDAKGLLQTLEPGLEDEVLQAIERARQGIRVTKVVIRRSTEPEDPDWEELVFEALARAPTPDAFAYWGRIADLLERLTEEAPERVRSQLIKLIWVDVNWS